MPGKHYTDIERNLLKQWANNKMSDGSLLNISIGGDKGIRGLKNVSIEFSYPVTVISGKNGSGKTTILALSALAYNGKTGYCPKNAKERSGKGYYTFNDFFYKGPGDSDLTGLTIEWNTKQGTGVRNIKLKKQTSKWMRYERRPERAVLYLGTSRLISAIELNVLKSHFKPGIKADKIVDLNNEYIEYLTYILRENYRNARELNHRDHAIRLCMTDYSSYSSFNMGAGEDVIIELLGCMQNMPKHSLCVIEEIELGIHPEALVRLAEVIQRIAKDKQMQFIISSHSSDFIDSLPREARIYLDKNGDSVNVVHSPTTRYAMGKLGGISFPEMVIFCEDDIAKRIIECTMKNSMRSRVSIIPIGSKSELVKAFIYNKKTTKYPFKGLIVWDGDVTENDIELYIGQNRELDYVKLHQEKCPEINIIQALLQHGIEELTSRLQIDSEEETVALLRELLTLADAHSFSYEVSKKTNMDKEVIKNMFIEIAVSNTLNDYKPLTDKILKVLS